MASDEQRHEVAEELRRQAAYSSGSLGEWWQRLQETVTGEVDFANPQKTYRANCRPNRPPDVRGLLARVKAVSRRYTVDNQSKDIIKYEDLTIDIGAYEVIYKGNIVRLAPKELELFHFMASNPNKVFTREQLMFEVWGYDYPGDSRTVDVHVKRLREKIKGGKEWELQTVWGVGYKFEVR